MADMTETLRKLGLAAARGVPQLATGFVDLAALPFTMTGMMKPEQAVGSTAYLTSKGLLPPPQQGLLSETTELVSSAMNPATATKAALAKGGLLAAPFAAGSIKPMEFSKKLANTKVLDEQNNLKMVYHGTQNAPEGIQKFNPTVTMETGYGKASKKPGGATWFTDSTVDASDYASQIGGSKGLIVGNPTVYPAYLNMKNPATPDTKIPGLPYGFDPEISLYDPEVIKKIKKAGYDGVVWSYIDDPIKNYVVFDNKQIISPFSKNKPKKPTVDMTIDRMNRFVFKENKNPDIVLTTSRDEFDPKYMNAYLEVLDKPEKVGGKGTATRLYLQALDVAKKNNMGWKSDTVTSDATKKMYQRLTNMGIPFQEVDNQFILSPEQLSKINLQKLPKK